MRDSSTWSKNKHDRRSCRGGIANEVSGSHHRQPMDVQTALRLPGSEGVGGGQRLVRLLQNIGGAGVAVR